MVLIQLHRPVASTPTDSPRRFERVHMFPGRHLGEEEFDRGQLWTDMRLRSLLQGRYAGVVSGLEVGLGSGGVIASSVSISPGLALDGEGRAVTLFAPLHAEWSALIAAWQSAHAGADPTGVYYLLLRRGVREIDEELIDPCQRFELDPTRDSRLLVTASLVLQRLSVDPAAVAVRSREQIENWVAADRVDGEFLRELGPSVPLALLAISATPMGAYRPLWVTPEAGRYEALPHAGYRVLLNQVSAALRRVQLRANSELDATTPLADFLRDQLQLDFLPAVGQLPLEWLQNPASTTPSLLWLPRHLGIDMIPVPEEAVSALLHQNIARRVVDLRHAAGDKIRLLVAVNEPDYRADLLDIPPTDPELERDLFNYHMRAHDLWRRWHEHFDRLYHFVPSSASEPPPFDLSQLGLPQPEPRPVLPALFLSEMIARADAALDPDQAGVPYPFDKPIPTPPPAYNAWLVAGQPPAPATPTQDGYVVQYALGLVELEAIESQVRAYRGRLEKTRDYLLLLRQQLDSQTVGLAALAGGVAGDGGGLQVARWLPYASLEAPKDPEVTATQPERRVSSNPTGSPKLSFVPTARAGFGTNLLSTALASTSSAARASQLASKPQTFSAFELGINQTRLQQLAAITKAPIAKPAYEAKEYRFSVIDHISPEVSEYTKAYAGMKELLASLKELFDVSDAAGLRSDMRKVGYAEEDNEATHDSPLQRSSRLESPVVLINLSKQHARTYDDGKPVPEVDTAKRQVLLLNQYRYHALFKAGRILTQWISICEARYSNLERKLQVKLREQAAKMAALEKLSGLVRVAREALELIDRTRVEFLGDYGVAQHLLEEDWRRVFQVNRERTRILTTRVRGLYYVRVRSTPVGARVQRPLPLRFSTASELVPGCDASEEVELPRAISQFFQAVCEIPMADWAKLKPLASKIPEPGKFGVMQQVRQTRYQANAAAKTIGVGSETMQARLHTVAKQTEVVLQQWAHLALPAFTTSIVSTQAAAAGVLSLEDLMLSQGALRNDAHALKQDLERAVCCLLRRIQGITGSLRLLWSQLAEDDQLRVDDPAFWPGMEQAEAEDFNTVRTIAELVRWLFGRLDEKASASSRGLLRNLMRAVLIHAALGDPDEIVRGAVHIPPVSTRVGERLLVKLDHSPRPGTRMQLLDPQQQLIAMLVAEDHGPDSTRVNIVEVIKPEVRINSRFIVVASKSTHLRKL